MADPAPRPERSFQGLLVLFLILAVLGSLAGGVYMWATGASGPTVPIEVEIPDGASAADVGNLLDEAGVIRSSLAFRIAAGLRGVGGSIQAGTYYLQTNMGLTEVLDVLENGPDLDDIRITFPEGLRVEEMAERVAGELGLDPDEFLGLARSGRYAIDPYLPRGTSTIEGFLFPKTYDFSQEALSVDGVIGRLLAQFEEEARRLHWRAARRLGLSPYEVVVVASMIEREARVPEDRAKISAVIHNRLRKGMLLQIDATVLYALPEHKDRLTYDDYAYPSPYNTYLHEGLPPTPIANPGLASLRAALRPARAGYLYYVVIDEDGRHAFTDSYDEFLRLKERAKQGG